MSLRITSLALVTFLVSCQQNVQTKNSSEKVTEPISIKIIEQAEQLAYEACVCEQQSFFSGDENKNCRDIFNQETKALFDEEYGTASYPITTNGLCSSETGQCIATDHELMLDDDHIPLCTDQDVEAIDAAFEKIMNWKMAEGFDLNQADTLAQQAVRKMIEPLRLGKSIILPSN